MDSTLLAVIIGSGISLLGTVAITWLTQHFALKKEERQWERRHQVKLDELIRKEEKADKERLRELYHNSMRALAVYIAAEEHRQEGKDGYNEKIEQVQEIHRWVAPLSLRYPDSQLTQMVEIFTTNPSSDWASAIRDSLNKQAQNEDALFGGLQACEAEQTLHTTPGMRVVKIKIDSEYRRRRLIEGIELPQLYTFQIDLKDMTESHRDRLTRVYFENSHSIPKEIQLRLPALDRHKKVNLKGKQWEASLNPNDATPLDILNAWENDFDRCLRETQEAADRAANRENS